MWLSPGQPGELESARPPDGYPAPRPGVRLHARRPGQLPRRPGDGRAGAAARAGDAGLLAGQPRFPDPRRRLCPRRGDRHFLDIGTGLPISPNTHELARLGRPEARVVYVDNDPVVFMRAEALLADDEHVAVVRADLRDVDAVLADAGRLLDFAEPVALMFVAVLHCIEDRDEAVAIAAATLPRSRPVATSSSRIRPTSSHRSERTRPRPRPPGGGPPGCRAAGTTSCGCSTAGTWSTPAWCSFPAGAPTATSPPGSPTGPGPTAASPGSSRAAVS